MIAEPTPTPYDLKFRSFGFPVRVHPLFWVISALLGANLLNDPNYGVLFLLMWVGVSFVSILVHEMGHGVAYRRYGGDGRLWLYWFGGLAISDTARPNPKQRIVIALAGPGAGFLLAAAVLLTNRASQWADASVLTAELYWQLMWVNLAWGIVNLLPIVPLDGGQVSREVCTLLKLRRPLETALKISIGAAAVCVAYSLFTMFASPRELARILPWWMPPGSMYTALMFGFLGYGSWQQLQFVGRYSTYGWDDPDDDTPPWRQRR